MIGRLLAMGCAVLLASNAPARSAWAELRPDRIRTELVTPTDPVHREIHARLKQERLLERMAEVLAPFRLPRDVTLKVAGCEGTVNAFYGDAVITICYEYLQYIAQHAPQDPIAEGITPREVIFGATVDLILHEMGHAVFDLLEIPMLGREEDAADQFSAYLQLHVGGEQARALILGAAFLGRVETQASILQNLQLKHYADVHGLPGQRYFNTLCMAYGFDPQRFSDVVSRWHLPADRAEGCDEEYAQVRHAFETLILPHIDQERFDRVRAKNLLRLDPLP